MLIKANADGSTDWRSARNVCLTMIVSCAAVGVFVAVTGTRDTMPWVFVGLAGVAALAFTAFTGAMYVRSGYNHREIVRLQKELQDLE